MLGFDIVDDADTGANDRRANLLDGGIPVVSTVRPVVSPGPIDDRPPCKDEDGYGLED